MCRRQFNIFSNIFFFKYFNILDFDDYIWNHREKCIQMSTNIPSIGSVISEIIVEMLWIFRKQTFLHQTNFSRIGLINAIFVVCFWGEEEERGICRHVLILDVKSSISRGCCTLQETKSLTCECQLRILPFTSNIFQAAGICADKMFLKNQRISKLLNLMTIFGITLKNAFK